MASATTLNVSFNGKNQHVKLSNTELELVSIGTFNIETSGYHTLEITGDDKAASIDISEILIGGAATESKVYFAKDDFYWDEEALLCT